MKEELINIKYHYNLSRRLMINFIGNFIEEYCQKNKCKEVPIEKSYAPGYEDGYDVIIKSLYISDNCKDIYVVVSDTSETVEDIELLSTDEIYFILNVIEEIYFFEYGE